MRVLLCTHHYPPRHKGGVEVHTARLARALAAQGETVSVVTTDDDPLLETGEIRSSESGGVRLLAIGNDRMARNPRDTLGREEVMRAFRKALQSTAPDVVHFQHVMHLGVETPAQAADLGIPVVLSLHEYWLLCARGGQLRRADGSLCETPDPEVCARCLLEHRFGRSPLEARVARMVRRLERVTGWNAFPLLKSLGTSSRSPGPTDAADPSDMRSFLDERLRRVAAMLSRVDVVLSPSRFLIGRFAASGLDVSSFRHWPNGVPELLPFGSEAPKRSVREGVLRVGFLGSIVAQKGLDLLVAAHGRLPRGTMELHIHGDVGFDPGFWRTVRKDVIPGETHVHGSFQPAELALVLSGLDVLVVPSRWYENAPLVISEARRAGVPVVAARLGGMAEMVRDDVDGLLFEPGDVASLAACLGRLAAEQATLERLAAAAPAPRGLAEEARDLRGLYMELRTGSGRERTR